MLKPGEVIKEYASIGSKEVFIGLRLLVSAGQDNVGVYINSRLVPVLEEENLRFSDGAITTSIDTNTLNTMFKWKIK